MSKIKQFKGYAKRLRKKGPGYFTRCKYLKYYKKYDIKDNVILFSSKHGADLAGNMFYLLKELCENPKYCGYRIFVEYDEKYKERIESLLKRYNLDKKVILVDNKSKKYYQVCSYAKYLFNDTSFLPFFIKKEEQVYLNTWHGTPWKCLGRSSESDFISIGNIQRNYMMSDYLLAPNEHTKNVFDNDYMLGKIARNTKCVLNGYPRNSVFFTDSTDRIKSWLVEDNIINHNIDKMYFYMPTWREKSIINSFLSDTEEGRSLDVAKYGHWLACYLAQIDLLLNDDEVLFVKLHPLDRGDIDLSLFKHIKDFPQGYETYDFLNACDSLITDYSSVFFDFEIANKPIILFTPDSEIYLNGRGVYFGFDKLPFIKVNCVDNLLNELRNPTKINTAKMLKKYNNYDSVNSPKQLLDLVLLNDKNNLIIDNFYQTDLLKSKKDIFIYTGSLAKNGITTSAINFIKHLNRDKYNIILSYREGDAKKNNPHIIKNLPNDISYMPLMGKTNMALKDKIILLLYRHNIVPFKWAESIMDDVYFYDHKRLYPYCKFDKVINYVGYEYKMIHSFARMQEPETIIFVHNDMQQEITMKHNQHRRTLKYAYEHYNKVAVVSEDMIAPTKAFTKKNMNCVVIPNLIDYDLCKENGEKDLEFNPNTKCHLDKDGLLEFIDSHSKVFLNVGRFSPEKGQERLIEAFTKLKEETKENIGLIILGGYGGKYDSVAYLTDSNKYYKDMVVIQSLNNPQPLYKLCDCFVLSSFYEGQGLVLAEADIQGIPVISTDIGGPHSFLKDTNGLLVENTTEGIYEGMKEFLNGNVKSMNLDYVAYNENVLSKINQLLS